MKLLGMLVVASALLMACGNSDGGESSGSSTPSPLSAAYQSNCQRCHGPVGEGKGSYPRIPNTKTTTEASFISQVRSGKGEMPAFAASQISDADLKADYLYLTTQR